MRSVTGILVVLVVFVMIVGIVTGIVIPIVNRICFVGLIGPSSDALM